MDPIHLKTKELIYELKIRNAEIPTLSHRALTGAVRAALLSERKLKGGTPAARAPYYRPDAELELGRKQLEDLTQTSADAIAEQNEWMMQGILSRGIHWRDRIQRVGGATDLEEQEKTDIVTGFETIIGGVNVVSVTETDGTPKGDSGDAKSQCSDRGSKGLQRYRTWL